MLNVGLFSQADERWGRVNLGTGGGHTLASAGCLVTAVAGMLADTFEVMTDPGRLNRWLCRNGGFVYGNLFVFDSLRQLGIASAVVDCELTPAPIDEVAVMLDAGGAVLAEVDFYPGGTVQRHWVRILRVVTDDCEMHDPWLPPGSGMYSLMARYGHYSWPGPARALFRLAFYQLAKEGAVEFADGAVHDAVQESVCVR